MKKSSGARNSAVAIASLPRLRRGHITRCMRFASLTQTLRYRSGLRIHQKRYLPRLIKYIAATTPIIANKNLKPGIDVGVGEGV